MSTRSIAATALLAAGLYAAVPDAAVAAATVIGPTGDRSPHAGVDLRSDGTDVLGAREAAAGGLGLRSSAASPSSAGSSRCGR